MLIFPNEFILKNSRIEVFLTNPFSVKKTNHPSNLDISRIDKIQQTLSPCAMFIKLLIGIP